MSSLGGGGVIKPVMTVPMGYVGPGNVVSGAAAWWGLRAYNAVTAGTKAINLRASGNNATSDFNTLSNGNLDVGSVSTFLATNGGSLFVTKLYDQTGNGLDLSQATAANQPAFVLSGLGSLPVMNSGTSTLTLTGPQSMTFNQPVTFSVVAMLTDNTTNRAVLSVGANITINTAGDSVNWDMYAGTALNTIPAANNVWHALQANYNTSSSTAYIDGTNISAFNAGSNSITSAAPTLFNYFGGQQWFGEIAEAGIWLSGNFTGPQNVAMNSNQHSYWGF